MAPQRALHNRIWEHKSSTILLSSVQNYSTDRVRCHPWSALIFWNAKIKQYAWPPSAPFDLLFGSNPNVFPSYTRKLSQFTLLSFFLFLAKMAWNAIVCETTDVSRENSIFPIFQKTWFQTILAKQKREKKKTRSTTILWSAKILQSAWILQYVYVPSCGVRRNYGMRRILSMRGWYRDHGGKFRGQNQNSNPKASPNFQGHTS